MTEKSYNGWVASPDPAAIGIDHEAVARGTTIHFPPGLKAGDVAFVLGYVAGEIHRRVEPAGNGVWGYAYRRNRNAANLSCHASGTAFDWNAPKHPNGKAGTFTTNQVGSIRKILDDVENAVKWGGDFHHTKDEMHFEVCVSATVLKGVASRLRQRLTGVGTRGMTGPDWWTHELFRDSKDDRSVRVARHNLHLPLDGVNDDDWDTSLERAVRSLQARAKLPITGRIDRATAKAIG